MRCPECRSTKIVSIGYIMTRQGKKNVTNVTIVAVHSTQNRIITNNIFLTRTNN